MKGIYIILLLLVASMFTGCELIGDVFSAGFYVGIFLVILVVGLIIYFIAKARK